MVENEPQSKGKQWERRGKKCLRGEKYLSVLTTGPSDPVSLSLNSSQTNFPAARVLLL